MTQLVTARGNLWFNPTANFYYITERSEPENIATNISQVFLGVRLECARCHNHPWERWSQDDFWGFAAFFGRMGVKDTYGGDQTQIILKDRGEVLHPRTKQAVTPKYLDGPGTTERPDEDIRDRLAAWITSPQNPWFARNIVNRLWKHYLGRGIVEPVDDMRITNPPTNESLLDALAQDFVQHGFRLKHTARTILNSRIYQLTGQPNQSNRGDDLNHSRFYPKKLMAEQLMDAISQATGVAEKYPGHKKGLRAMQLPSGAPTYFLQTFGRQMHRRKIRERQTEPDMAQGYAPDQRRHLDGENPGPRGVPGSVDGGHFAGRPWRHRTDFLDGAGEAPQPGGDTSSAGADPGTGPKGLPPGLRGHLLGRDEFPRV